MDVREKLVEIIQNSVGGCARHWAEVIADGLIAHGVTVQECKLGDKKSNADRIRSMTDDELKFFICSNSQCKFCKYEGWGGCELLKWLQQPAEDDDNETVGERKDGDWNG